MVRGFSFRASIDFVSSNLAISLFRTLLHRNLKPWRYWAQYISRYRGVPAQLIEGRPMRPNSGGWRGSPGLAVRCARFRDDLAPCRTAVQISAMAPGLALSAVAISAARCRLRA